MTSRLDLAVDAVARISQNGGDIGEILRADVDPSGALVLCCAQATGLVWLQFDGERLVERSPSDDPLVPLASEQRNDDNDCKSTILSYRPGRRLVLLRSERTSEWIEKGYRRRRWKAAADRYRIAEKATSAVNSFRVPQLRRERADCSSLAFERLVGVPVTASAARVETFYAVGAALRCFQEATVTGGNAPVFRPEDELRVLERWGQHVHDLAGLLPNGWRTTADKLRATLDSLPAPVLRLAHRDLHDRQLLEVEERIGLLDFDLLCWADTGLDLANLLAHLSLRSLQDVEGTDEAGVVACGRALLEGAAREEESGFWQRLRFYETATFLRLALVYSLRPRWSHLPTDLLELGRRCLEEVR